MLPQIRDGEQVRRHNGQKSKTDLYPTSGREETKKRLPEILQRLERGGFETSAHATIGEGDATLAAAEAVNRGFDLIIAAGGDGTLCEVVNGMAEKEGRPPLGILPLGTTNDFARALGIPKNLEQACDLIIQQYTTDIVRGNLRTEEQVIMRRKRLWPGWRICR